VEKNKTRDFVLQRNWRPYILVSAVLCQRAAKKCFWANILIYLAKTGSITTKPKVSVTVFFFFLGGGRKKGIGIGLSQEHSETLPHQKPT